MQLQHVRKSDLNLLPALLALLEERSISKAAERHHLSQPAMSRVLQRLRQTFQDELLIRSAMGYELTARGRSLLDELRGVLPELERLLRGARFDPATSEAQFHICCPDLATLRMAPGLAAHFATAAPGVSLIFKPWTADSFHDLERGKADIAIWGKDIPAQFRTEVIVEDEIVCALRADGPIARRGKITRREYAEAKHVRVATFAGVETVFERRIEAHGIRPQVGLSVPYFGAAVLAVATTDLIATVPRSAVTLYQGIANVAMLPPPFPVEPLHIVMAWHPRLDADPAHVWLRTTISRGTQELSPPS